MASGVKMTSSSGSAAVLVSFMTTVPNRFGLVLREDSRTLHPPGNPAITCLARMHGPLHTNPPHSYPIDRRFPRIS